jgi:glycosyltransferase involved in cell wall biosynthesis
MKLLLITDAWDQMNGVVTTFVNTIRCMEANGHQVEVIHPGLFKTKALPTYKEIKIAINPWKIKKMIRDSTATHIHIATEGPLGLFASRYCTKYGISYTTSYHTKMPEYIRERFKFIPLWLSYAYMRLIHKHSKKILVTTPSMKTELEQHGFKNSIEVWGRGVDTNIFNNDTDHPTNPIYDYPKFFKPYALYVGRVSIEKNIDAFLDMNIPMNKIIVGSGPYSDELHDKCARDHTPSKNHPNCSAVMVGTMKGKELQEWYANASAFVFPSKTDTFGIVMLEAMACGTPVVAYPVTGPIDCVEQGVTGVLDDDLEKAFGEAIKLDRNKVAAFGSLNTWEKCTAIFEKSLVSRNWRLYAR